MDSCKNTFHVAKRASFVAITVSLLNLTACSTISPMLPAIEHAARLNIEQMASATSQTERQYTSQYANAVATNKAGDDSSMSTDVSDLSTLQLDAAPLGTGVLLQPAPVNPATEPEALSLAPAQTNTLRAQDEVAFEPAPAASMKEEFEPEVLPEIVSRKVYESRAANVLEVPTLPMERNVNDGFNFAPIKASLSIESATSTSAPVVTTETPELTEAAIEILANAESAEASLALAQSLNGTAATATMPQVWVQDSTAPLDSSSLEPFSIDQRPMYQRDEAFEPIETDFGPDTEVQAAEPTEPVNQNIESLDIDREVQVATKNIESKHYGTRQASYNSTESVSTFVNVQSSGGEFADVIGGETEWDPSITMPCETCPEDQTLTPCPSTEMVTVPSSAIRPPDEYICDGGDAGIRVRVRDDWTVDGLDLEDTVGHFDTLDGRTLVSPSNSVCVYAPRFANVRKVVGAFSDEKLIEPGRLFRPEIVGQDRQHH
ncbi:MAG: hypothetical protein KDB27_04060, partial [Planctomycetales bacterium]|nr:hypothetical protein [Planctomycetales bacterium]